MLGYPDANSEFKFDLSLNYRLSGVIQCYSDQKPTLVVREGGVREREGERKREGEGGERKRDSVFLLLVLCH